MKAMEKVAIKNRVMFFGGTAIVGVIAVFIFAVAFAGAPHAHAYTISSEPPADTNAGTGSYDAGNSLQNLVSPFTNFFSNLKWDNNANNTTTINPGGPMIPAYPTTSNLTPTLENGIQSVVSGWLSQFNSWFYSVTGVQLSGIFYVLLNAIAWTLGLAQQVVNWLLGLFH